MVHDELPELLVLELLLFELLVLLLLLFELVELLVPAPPDPLVVSLPPPQAASEKASGIAKHTTLRMLISNSLFESGALGARDYFTFFTRSFTVPGDLLVGPSKLWNAIKSLVAPSAESTSQLADTGARGVAAGSIQASEKTLTIRSP